MRTLNVSITLRFFALSKRLSLFLAPLIFCSAVALAQTDEFQPNSSSGPSGILVHSKFGGQIFGFDIDQNGTEGLLAEAKSLSNGNVLAAVETFDQASGRILDVVELTQPSHSQDDFITLGIVGNSVGLAEHENVSNGFVTTRTFNVLNPLSS